MTTDLEKRVSLLKSLPLFAHLPAFELQQLAQLFRDVQYPTNTFIVRENENIESVFIIVEGNAEVSQLKTTTTEKEIISVLHAGEAIGLDDMGFFSKNPARTATAMALTSLVAIRLDLLDLKQFFQAHPMILSDMQQATYEMLLYAFIKKIEPFAEVSHDVLEEIIPFIKTIDIPADTIIFRQGDHADCCYLLYEGNVKVTLTKKNGSEKRIAELGPAELLGEMALLTDNKRNATAKTLTACKLFVLEQNEFQKIAQHSINTGVALTSMLMNRHRPLHSENITIHRRKDAEQKTIIILKNAEKGAYVKTNEQGLFVWQRLDGEHTLQEIAVEYFFQFHKIAIESIGNLVLYLMQAGFVKTPMLVSYVPQTTLPRWMRALALLRSIMEYEYDFKNVDDWITRLYQKAGYLFFSRTAKIVMALLAIMGFFAFVIFFQHATMILKNMPQAWMFLLLIGPANLLAVPLHELAHALTTKAYGYQVHRLGVGWFWLGPIAFADTSDMWLSTRGPRIAVNLAGIYVNIVISGILAFIALCLPYPILAVFLWLVALSSYLIAFYNLNPTFEFDGYYVLMDVLDKPNLRAHAIQWLLHDFKKMTGYFSEIVYWLISISFILLASFVAYVIQLFVFNMMLPEKVSNTALTHFGWVLPIVVIVLSFLSLYGKIKQQAYYINSSKQFNQRRHDLD